MRDYFLFDPLHEYLERPLIGYRLIGNKYEPIQHAADGGLLSQELGVRLVPEGQELAYIHFGTGLRLPTPDHFEETLLEERQRVASAEQRSEREKQRAEAEKQRAEAEKQRAESAEQRLAALEAELARIKAAPSSTSPGQPRVTDP